MAFVEEPAGGVERLERIGHSAGLLCWRAASARIAVGGKIGAMARGSGVLAQDVIGRRIVDLVQGSELDGFSAQACLELAYAVARAGAAAQVDRLHSFAKQPLDGFAIEPRIQLSTPFGVAEHMGLGMPACAPEQDDGLDRSANAGPEQKAVAVASPAIERCEREVLACRRCASRQGSRIQVDQSRRECLRVVDESGL